MSGIILRHWLRLQGRLRFPKALIYGQVAAGAEIGEGAWIPFGTRVAHDCAIGRFSYIMPPSHLQQVQMGSFCSVGEGVHFLSHQHNAAAFSTFPFARRLAMQGIDFSAMYEESIDKGAIRIGHDVWIGTGSCVMGGVTIGTGAVVGAGAVVTKDIEPYAIVAGVPAREVRKRFSDAAITRLLASNWWDWPLEEIQVRSGELAELTRG